VWTDVPAVLADNAYTSTRHADTVRGHHRERRERGVPIVFGYLDFRLYRRPASTAATPFPRTV
jgi:hypothetical protein